jgi:hypothetical protein
VKKVAFPFAVFKGNFDVIRCINHIVDGSCNKKARIEWKTQSWTEGKFHFDSSITYDCVQINYIKKLMEDRLLVSIEIGTMRYVRYIRISEADHSFFFDFAKEEINHVIPDFNWDGVKFMASLCSFKF